jgi:hypothetical protein
LAVHAWSQIVARVAGSTHSILISRFTVCVSASGGRAADSAVSSIDAVSGIAGETVSSCRITGLAKRVILCANSLRAEEVSTVTFLANIISKSLAIDI